MTAPGMAPTPVVPADVENRRRRINPVPVRRRAGRAGDLVVACILDEFSYNSFAGEADLAPLTMENWLVEISAAQPDLLLVESAWRGHKQTWWNTVHRHGAELTGIVQWCRSRGIPTAFWNKEDPVHFNTFLTTASMFDAVFTTDLDCVPRYKQHLGHTNVHFLPFAAQPAESNPIEEFERIDGCAFAGAYYERYPERLADLAELSAELSTGSRRFDIYDRNLGKHTPGYQFPDEYQSMIVGGALTPDMLAIPYKGYTTNLNLNSVKQSQSMFARRVFEVMASNTLVVSNFSRGLRAMFGQLSISTDSGVEMRRRLDALETQPNGNERLRAMALRKVLREHTYAERLAFIAAHSGATLRSETIERPLLVLEPSNEFEERTVLEALTAQSHTDWRLLVLAGSTALDDPRVTYGDRASIAATGLVEGCTHLGWLDKDAWYGPHYLEDLILGLRFADVAACGHVERFIFDGGSTARRDDAGTQWSMQPNLLLARSLMLVDDWDSLPWDLDLEDASELSHGPGLAVGPVEFVAGGATASAAALSPASTLDVDTGLSLTDLRNFAASLHLDDSAEELLPRLRLAEILADLPPHPELTMSETLTQALELTSTLPAGQHVYWNCSGTVPRPDVLHDEMTVYLDIPVGLDAMLVVYFLDDEDRRIGHALVGHRRNITFTVPDNCTRVRWGLRVSGPGTTQLDVLYLAEFLPPPLPLLPTADHLVISNIYPSYDNLYRNAFVHTRLRRYHQADLHTEVVLLAPSPAPAFREFENVDVATISPEVLSTTLAEQPERTLVVHTLSPGLWKVLKTAEHRGRVVVWVHGFEIQPWWRRRFNYATEAELAEAQQVSDERMTFWRGVFHDLPENIHFVFVSRTFAESVFEDIGKRLPEAQYSIIHNPIDTELFAYREKEPELRKRILSIRPYHTRVYANDLAVQAVLDLEHREGFDDLHFTFYGDGPLFQETVEPLRRLNNVEIHQGFLTHEQIAAVHREHGVLLVPTRSDTQGVSRDEAMSSGLVPVTSAVAAVPEFVDDTCAILAQAEDHQGLAEGIWSLAFDSNLFKSLSTAASSRVRGQCGAHFIVPQEVSVINQTIGNECRRL
ncbi:glycosyltransferase [Janibacter sp. LM]|uniref:glycosyltransferase family protein n=1 Tax=Janibacter sp. LM TaxID=3144845 RepID=UPI0031F7034E